MPLIVVGADTAPGQAILDEIGPAEREIRVFVSDPSRALEFKDKGYKVATGDISDESHVEAASTRCFSAVLVVDAAIDERERSFADSVDEVLQCWAHAVSNSNVKRVIWVTGAGYPPTDTPEVACVDPAQPGFARTVIELDDAYSIS